MPTNGAMHAASKPAGDAVLPFHPPAHPPLVEGVAVCLPQQVARGLNQLRRGIERGMRVRTSVPSFYNALLIAPHSCSTGTPSQLPPHPPGVCPTGAAAGR